MPRVEFHELRGPRWETALCHLVEQLHGQGERLYLWAESEAKARELDGLLWTFRDEAFVPHALWQGEPRLDDPVAVGWKGGNPNAATRVVLVRDASPEDVREFPEIVDLAPVGVPALRDAARRRFRAFREAGYSVAFHASPG